MPENVISQKPGDTCFFEKKLSPKRSEEVCTRCVERSARDVQKLRIAEIKVAEVKVAEVKVAEIKDCRS